MFTEPFPAFPSMFDGPFTNVEASQASQAGERIIPIKVVSSKSDLQQVETERQEGGGQFVAIRSLILEQRRQPQSGQK